MEEYQFKKAALEDKEIIDHYFRHHTSRSCRENFCKSVSLVKTVSGKMGSHREYTCIQK